MADPSRRRLPPQAQIARAVTFVQPVPVALAAVVDFVILIMPGARPVYRSDVWFIGGALALGGVAVISAVRLGPVRRWAWAGSVTVNVAMAIAWTAAVVWAYIETTRINGTDPGMVFVSIAFVSLPMIAISVAAVGLLSVRSVLRCCLTGQRAS